MARPAANSHVPALIRSTPALGDDGSATDIRRLIPAWIISGVIHVILLSLFLLITVSQVPAIPGNELSVIESQVQDSPNEHNLTMDDIGNNSELETNYNNPRDKEEVSLPGPPNMNEKLGILNAPEAPQQTIPPPAGFGGSVGQGGSIDDPTRSGSGSLFGPPGGLNGAKLNYIFDGRSGGTKERMLHEGGGNTRSEACVAAGLKWLALHQAVDGSWGPASFHRDGKNCNCSGPGHDDRMFGTALALLPFLGAGEAHRGVNKHSIYAKHVERAMKWMVGKQNADGVLSGNGYIQGMAALTLCELYGLTSDPQLKGPAQRAINAVINWQAADGGFRYGPKMNGDTSVTGWHIQALKSGQMAGLNVPNATLAQCINFLDKVSTPDGSVVGYMTPDDRPDHTRTQAIGLLCRQYFGWGPRHPGLAKGVEILRAKHLPTVTYKDMYYYYYATQVMHHFGGPEWHQWNFGVNGKPGMRDILIERQDQGQNPERRHQKGSWDPAGDAYGPQFGRLGHTCLCILTLEVYYRHLPLYRRELGAMKDPVARNAAK